MSLFLAVLFGAAVLFAGLVDDIGHVLNANADAFDLAGKAARVGAQQLDPVGLAAGQVRVNPATAATAVHAYLAGHNVDGQVTVTGATVTVTVEEHVGYRLLSVVHPGGTTVTQTRSATATLGP